MKTCRLSLKQNLSCAKIFLNLFDLILEDQESVDEFTKFKILDKENQHMGELFFKNDFIEIKSNTKLGLLSARYHVAKYWGLEDKEFNEAMISWAHEILFDVAGNVDFKGNMQIGASMDTQLGNKCGFHTTIEYIDKEGRNVAVKVMDEGYPFRYMVDSETYNENLLINNCYSPFMRHVIFKGKKDSNKIFWPYEEGMVRSVSKYDNDDILRTVSYEIENYEQKNYKNIEYEKIEDDEFDPELNIRKGLLMQRIDPDFSKKIQELINHFKIEDVSFLENLIDVSLDFFSEEVKSALFGLDIKKIDFYNGSTNLSEAYFGLTDSNYPLKHMLTMVLK